MPTTRIKQYTTELTKKNTCVVKQHRANYQMRPTGHQWYQIWFSMLCIFVKKCGICILIFGFELEEKSCAIPFPFLSDHAIMAHVQRTTDAPESWWKFFMRLEQQHPMILASNGLPSLGDATVVIDNMRGRSRTMLHKAIKGAREQLNHTRWAWQCVYVLTSFRVVGLF